MASVKENPFVPELIYISLIQTYTAKKSVITLDYIKRTNVFINCV